MHSGLASGQLPRPGREHDMGLSTRGRDPAGHSAAGQTPKHHGHRSGHAANAGPRTWPTAEVADQADRASDTISAPARGPWPAGCHIAYRSETRGNASGPPVGHGATAPGGDAHIANRSETRGNASGPPVKATDCLALETSCDTRPVGQPSLHWIPHQITKAGRPGHEPAPYLSQESDTGQISQARARGASGSVPRFHGPTSQPENETSAAADQQSLNRAIA